MQFSPLLVEREKAEQNEKKKKKGKMRKEKKKRVIYIYIYLYCESFSRVYYSSRFSTEGGAKASEVMERAKEVARAVTRVRAVPGYGGGVWG